MQVQSCLTTEMGSSAMLSHMGTVEDDIQLVRDLVAWANTNPNQISKKINKPNTTINRFNNGKATNRLHRDTLAALIEAYPDFPGFAERPAPNARTVRMEGPSIERVRDDLPIYGTALGAAREIEGVAIEQTTLNRAEIVKYAKRPVILNDKPGAYGLWVSGSSMEPRYMDGELLVADPGGRLRNGEDVVVYLRPTNPDDDDGECARAVMVKRLVRRTATYVELEQFTPPSIFRVNMPEIVRIDRVIPITELIG